MVVVEEHPVPSTISSFIHITSSYFTVLYFILFLTPPYLLPYIILSLGWQDVSLIAEGRAEAAAAGKLLKRHGYTLDVVYTR